MTAQAGWDWASGRALRLTRSRKNRALPFEARLSKPSGEDREFVCFDRDESLARPPGMASSSPSGLAATEEDASLHPGDVVAEVRAGLVQTAACERGAIEIIFRTDPQTRMSRA